MEKSILGKFDFADNSYDLKITKVYPEVRNGRFSIDFEFIEEQPEKMRIGQTFRIKLELGEPQEATLLQRGGFYQTTGGQWVFVVDPSGEFATKREVRFGAQNPTYYEILEGLEPGEKVIVSSYENFGDAEKLILK